MIRVQESVPCGSRVLSGDRVLVGSDLPDNEAARREVDDWINAQGWRVAPDVCPVAVYENGVRVREWVVAERGFGTITKAAGRLHFHFSRLRSQPDLTARNAAPPLQPATKTPAGKTAWFRPREKAVL